MVRGYRSMSSIASTSVFNPRAALLFGGPFYFRVLDAMAPKNENLQTLLVSPSLDPMTLVQFARHSTFSSLSLTRPFALV